MNLVQKELEERPTAERALRSLGEAVGLSRSTIFRHLHSSAASVSQHEIELRGQIQSVALEMRAYGYRPITKELQRRGVLVNHKRVLRLLRQDNLLSLRRQAFVRTTDSDHSLPVYPNLANRTVPPGLVHHSDRGVQYAAADYVALLQEHRIQISMSRRAIPMTTPRPNGSCERSSTKRFT